MLHGRSGELHALDRLLAEARQGRSGALLLRGEAGIGKSVLLDHAAHAAREAGMRVLSGTGVEAEGELPYAGLHLMLSGVLDRVAGLPAAQADALRSAFGMTSDGTGGDRFLVGLAVLTLLDGLAEERPLLCVVDDAHWLDRESADALLFAVRRLGAEPIAVLLAVREDDAPAFPAPGVPELRLGGLDAESAGALLDESAAGLPRHARELVLKEAAGNPLALRELPTVQGEAERYASPYGMAALPPHSRLLRAFTTAVTALPEPTRALLLVAAAAGGADLATVLGAAERFDASLDDLEPAERARLLGLADGRLAFRHPLIRTAVYQDAPTSRRIAAHRALADALAGRPDHADQRAWHLAAAGTGPDPETARLLEETAERARARGSSRAVAAAYERAAELTPDAAGQCRRLTAAARAAADAGRPAHAEELAGRAAALADGPEALAGAVRIKAEALDEQGRSRDAYALLAGVVPDLVGIVPELVGIVPDLVGIVPDLVGGVPGLVGSVPDRVGPGPELGGPASGHVGSTRDLDGPARELDGPAREAVGSAPEAVRPAPELVGPLLFQAAQAAWHAGDQDALDRTAAQAAGLGLSEAGRIAALARLAAGQHRCGPGDPGAGADAVRQLIGADGESAADLREVVRLGWWHLFAGDLPAARDLAVALERRCRESGAIGTLALVQMLLARVQLLLGLHREALATATEGMRVAEDTGHARVRVHLATVLAQLAAVRGDEEGCRELTAEALARGVAPGTVHAACALALLDLGLGRTEAAFDRLSAVASGPDRQGVIGSLPDLVEAAARLDRPDGGRSALAWYERHAAAYPRPWTEAVAERCRALLSPEPAEAGKHFAHAVRLHREGGSGFERARTELLYGEHLRRRRQTSEARPLLRSALDAFDRLGAAPWAERARTELRATGESLGVPAATPGLLDRLTPQEAQVARLAADGLSNRDIGARLFISPRTAGYHLSNVYPKLGISSRRELARLGL
ncbi:MULTISPECIES: helix-turn-helix transcriptional regulator [Streptomyces]|uniref:helix-turn-helix transcriptional regulator n=1 Tax=Streptomyces TaxID=1883 RepID=UPI00163D1E28|nr:MULTISPECIES: helix-turn-helix transcriptional regulator [Streptomyces]MBC2873796.1 AAA family ATPase [Streptomyces sp. TYQ1024]UBI37781.1 AAA family ATPase [Streptomyces mobaraensis]UKW30369.1 AAA family ATPase [Streptomyces sp. TYQ1024]